MCLPTQSLRRHTGSCLACCVLMPGSFPLPLMSHGVQVLLGSPGPAWSRLAEPLLSCVVRPFLREPQRELSVHHGDGLLSVHLGPPTGPASQLSVRTRHALGLPGDLTGCPLAIATAVRVDPIAACSSLLNGQPQEVENHSAQCSGEAGPQHYCNLLHCFLTPRSFPCAVLCARPWGFRFRGSKW